MSQARPAFRGLMGTVGCLLMVLVTGCANVPARTAPVVIGRAPQGGVPEVPDYAQQPQAPRPGWSPDTVVRNFISALATADPVQSVARQYLTSAASDKWVPGNLVTVIDTSSVQPGDSASEVTLSYSRVARIGPDGVYESAAATVPYNVTLAKVSGEWRIQNPPDGILLTRSAFDQIYSQANLYFLNSTETKLVPDLRYFPRDPTQRANTLIQGLLDGASRTIRTAVRNELASPVDLQSNVVYDPGVVQVRLKGVAPKNANQLAAMSAQIVLTLGDVSPEAVRITNDGQFLDIPKVGATQTAADWESFDPNFQPEGAAGYFLRNGAVLTSAAKPLPGAAGTGELGITAAGLSVDSARLAAVSSGGPGEPVLYQGPVQGPIRTVKLTGTKTLTDPTWGPSVEEFWVVRNGDEVIRVPIKGNPSVVGPTSFDSLGKVTVMRMSRDGVRVAFLIEKGPTSRLYLSSIIRDSNGIRLSEPLPLSDLNVVDFSWTDPRQIVVFSTDTSADVSAYSLLIDGSERDPVAVPVLGSIPTAIAATKDRPLLCSGEGAILRLDDSNWVPLIAGQRVSGSKPFYPG